MLRATPQKVTPEKRKGRAGGKVRFPGITEDARILGCNRVTLYRVLTGQWPQLKGLKDRYDALKAEQNK